MKALVTGGAGFIGSHVVEHLLARRRQVIVLDDFSSGRIENLSNVIRNRNLRIVKGSITDSETVAKVLTGVDAVFHEAAIVSEVRSLENPLVVNRVNVAGTVTLLEEARKAEVERFVFASSCGVYGNSKGLPIKEETPMAPRTPYAASKAAGEQYCMAFRRLYGLSVTCLRYANVYGPRRSVGPYGGVMVKFAQWLLSNKPVVIFGDGRQTRDFVYSTDVADATILAAECSKSKGMVINVGTGIATSVNDLARIMMEATGKTCLGAIRAPPRQGGIRFSQVDTGLARRTLGFRCKVPLREGIGSFLKWYSGRAERS